MKCTLVQQFNKDIEKNIKGKNNHFLTYKNYNSNNVKICIKKTL